MAEEALGASKESGQQRELELQAELERVEQELTKQRRSLHSSKKIC